MPAPAAVLSSDRRKGLTYHGRACYPAGKKFTKLTGAIREHADVSEANAQAIAKGLLARGLIEEGRVGAPKLCECCGTLFHPDHAAVRYCSDECVALFQHL